jgi:hypothetical protein
LPIKTGSRTKKKRGTREGRTRIEEKRIKERTEKNEKKRERETKE